MLKKLSKKQERIMEFLLVESLVILPAFLNGLFVYTGLINLDYSQSSAIAVHILQIVSQVTVLAVFLYVLYRQGRGLDYIGFSFSWKDIFSGFGLFVLAYISTAFINAMILFYAILLGFNLETVPENIEIFHMGPISITLIIMMIVNSFYEELIVRAYFITEVESFAKNTYLALFLCVLIQSSYHIYQGLMPLLNIAVVFLIFSFYYIKKRKIMPLIFAHTYLNIFSAILSRLLENYSAL